MTGTLLAVILSQLLTLTLGVALFAYWRDKQRPDAKPTQRRRAPEFVTHEEMEEAIEKASKKLEWEWTEMYEKFEKLHLRLAKREKREQQQQQLPLSGNDDAEESPPSILHLRRAGSI